MTGQSKVWEKVTHLCTLILALTSIAALWYANAQINASHNQTDAQIREARNQAQIQHLDELLRRFEEGSLLEARTKLARSRIDEKHETVLPMKPDDEPAEMDTLLNFFDYVGLLEKHGYLDKEDVWDQFGYYIFAFNADAQQVISEAQKHNEYYWANVTSLMKDLKEIDDRKDHSKLSQETTQDDLYEFYASEAVAQVSQPLPQGRQKKK
jgi:hypothetical protein